MRVAICLTELIGIVTAQTSHFRQAALSTDSRNPPSSTTSRPGFPLVAVTVCHGVVHLNAQARRSRSRGAEA